MAAPDSPVDDFPTATLRGSAWRSIRYHLVMQPAIMEGLIGKREQEKIRASPGRGMCRKHRRRLLRSLTAKSATTEWVMAGPGSGRIAQADPRALKLSAIGVCVTSVVTTKVAFREQYGYTFFMIKSFSHKGLEKFFLTGSRAGIQARHANKLRLILAQLNNAEDVQEMDIPTLRFHQLKGYRSDIWSVTVQANWRITFRFEDGDAEIVNYEDYH